MAAHPLREHLRWQLMLALYRSGRRADALELYQDTRQVLVHELGLEASRKLQRLQRAILRRPSVPPPRPPRRPRGHGRCRRPPRPAPAQAEAALERLVDAHLLDSPAAGRYRLNELVRLFARERAHAARTSPPGMRRCIGSSACHQEWLPGDRQGRP